MKEQIASQLTIQQPGLMTKKGRVEIADWLRWQANCLEQSGDTYTTKKFVARYWYATKKKCSKTMYTKRKKKVSA